MKIKNIITMVFMIISINACSMGSRPPKPQDLPERKMQDKLFRPCQDFETKNPVGKFCNRVCKKRSGKKCKEWTTHVKDFSSPEVFKFFRAGSFILIDEDQVL